MAEIKISIKAARVNAGLSQDEASEKLNINRKTLINYEQGKHIPQWNTVLKMVELYGVPVENLVFLSPTVD